VAIAASFFTKANSPQVEAACFTPRPVHDGRLISGIPLKRLPLPRSLRMKIHIDGQLLDKEDAKISVFDHGLLYGDGVFEGIRIYHGRIFRLTAHLKRLYESARSICMEIPIPIEEMEKATLDTVAANNLQDGYIRLVITRGVGSLGLNPFQCPRPSVIIIASTISLYPAERYEKGLNLITCATRRPTPAALSPQVKSLNYLNNVMAKIEAINANAEEGVMLNEQGFVAECTGDNLFIVRDGTVVTPPVSAGALNGITRRVIFDLAPEVGVPIHEEELTRYELYTADECFLTGTAAEVVPVAVYDRRLIGDGKPGPITLRFIERFRHLVKNTGTPIYS
jgi:branched-chain amino acid aminotransferase